MLKNLSLNRKLIFAFLLAGVVPASLITVVVVNKVSNALTMEAKSKLVAIREAKAFQLEELYLTISGQISALSQNHATIQASQEFQVGYSKYQKEAPHNLEKSKNNLKDFYNNKFGKQYSKINIGKSFSRLQDTYEVLNNTQILLQDSFISNNKNPLGSKDALIDLDDKTSYAKIHSKFHSTFRTYLNKFGYYDIFIADANSGELIYSVYKELDFATNIKNGAYSKSAIGKAFNFAVNAKDKNDVFFTEVEKYYPSYDAPAQFVSAPIYKNNKVSAVLIFQIPVAKINAILTSNEKWKNQGQGYSGETYVIGKDKIMKSISRFIVEDPKGFFEVMTNIGMGKQSIDYMKSQGTSAIAAKIETIGAENVTSGKTGFDIFPDYRNVDVLSAYRPLKIPGLKWSILSEMDQDEALASLYNVKKIVYGLIVGSIILILLFSVTFSRSISKSLVGLAKKLQDYSVSIMQAAMAVAQNSTDLSSATQQQAASLQETSSSITEISAMLTRSTDNTSSTSTLSKESQTKAEVGQRSVLNVKSRIDSIHKNNENLVDSVDKNNQDIENITKIIDDISNKTKVINDIVFQTKLLSFNASVEAARAGEHGKGFAVVAEEIGALAQMSGKAASEISDLLSQSISKVHDTVNNSKSTMEIIIKEGKESVDEGLKEITTCDSTLAEILTSFQKVNASVQEIATSSTEQSSAVREITNAIQELDAVTQKNTSIAYETSIKADELKGYSGNLSDIVDEVQTLVFGEGTQEITSSPDEHTSEPIDEPIDEPFDKIG